MKFRHTYDRVEGTTFAEPRQSWFRFLFTEERVYVRLCKNTQWKSRTLLQLKIKFPSKSVGWPANWPVDVTFRIDDILFRINGAQGMDNLFVGNNNFTNCLTISCDDELTNLLRKVTNSKSTLIRVRSDRFNYTRDIEVAEEDKRLIVGALEFMESDEWSRSNN